MKTWTKPFVHNDKLFEAVFLKVPHREFVEASVHLDGRTLKVKELYLTEKGLIERLKDELDKLVRPQEQ